MNENIFKTFTDDSCWLLGLIWTDGYIKSHSLTIASKDVCIANQLVRIFNYPKGLKNYKGYWYYIIHSKEIANDLYNLGLKRAKTFTIEYPKTLPDKWFWSFYRGVIDGDGCIYIDKNGRLELVVVTASKSFKESIVNKLKIFGFESHLTIRSKFLDDGTLNKNWKGHDIWNIRITQRYDLYKIFEFLYPNNINAFLDRKYEKFKNWYNNGKLNKKKNCRPKKWSEKEDLFLINNYKLMNNHEISTVLNRTYQSIALRKNKLYKENKIYH